MEELVAGFTTNLTAGQLVTAINGLPQFGAVSLSEVTLLSGGLCNVNVRVGQGSRPLLVRFLSRADIANPIDRQSEFAHQRVAASHRLAPQPLVYYPIEQLLASNNELWSRLATQFSGVIVADYCAGQALTSAAGIRPSQLESVASLLATLHQIPDQLTAARRDIRSEPTTPFTRLAHYWQLFCGQYPGDIDLYQRLIGQILSEIGEINITRRCLIHGDVNPGNIIINGRQARFIDWEYSDFDDPYIDLASTVVELKLASAARADFIAHYSLQCGEVSERRLMIFESYYCALCWLWSKIHHCQVGSVATQQAGLAANARTEYYFRRLMRNIRGTK